MASYRDLNGSAARRFTVASLLALQILLLSPASMAANEPYLPAGAEEVLLSIPADEREKRARIRNARRDFLQSPDSAVKAAALANAYLDLHEKLGDPRYLGYASSVIRDYQIATAENSLPAQLRLISADLLQARHEFTAAEAQINAVIAKAPDQWTAWLMLASIAETRGNYELARRACAQLIFAGQTLHGLTCAASVASMRGQSTAALQQLEQALNAAADYDPETLAWSHVVAAEIALRLGRVAQAETYLQHALSLRNNLYSRLLLADLLLEQGRFEDADSLTRDLPATDAVLVRRAEIAKQSSHGQFPVLAELLQRRVKAMHLRGEFSHGREEAQIALLLEDAPERALASALRNWEQQRESIDALLLLEAALAAGDAAAARPVLDWMETHNSDDVRLLQLRSSLERISS